MGLLQISVLALGILGSLGLVHFAMLSLKLRTETKAMRKIFELKDSARFVEIMKKNGISWLKGFQEAQLTLGNSDSKVLLSRLETLAPKFVWALRLNLLLVVFFGIISILFWKT